MSKQITITIGEVNTIIGSKDYNTAPVTIKISPEITLPEVIQTLTGVLNQQQNVMFSQLKNLEEAIKSVHSMKKIN